MRRRLLAIVVALPIVLAGATFGAWLWLTASVRTAVEQWAQQQRAGGTDVTWQALDVSGPPWRLTSHIDGAKIGRTDGPLPWSWSPPPLALDVFPLKLDEFGLAAGGLHRVDLLLDGRPRRLVIATTAAGARVRLDGDGLLAALAGRAQDLQFSVVDEPFELRAAQGEIAIERPPSAGRPAAALAVSLIAMARFDGVVLPVIPTGPFGQTVELIGAAGELRGVLPKAPPAQALEAWRADGGTLELQRLELIWGPLRAVADGTLALDADLQPVAALVARVQGLTDAIDAMELAALIDGRTAAIARLAVVAFSRVPDGGGVPELQVPVTIQDRQLSLGPVRLVTLPRLAWP